MPFLIISDTHFTDSPRDDYMWDLFQWLHEKIEEHSVDILIILGDLCERKDRHPSTLVNRLVYNLALLSKKVDIHILPGNHDGIDATNPFFQFLHGYDRIYFHLKIEKTKLNKCECLFLPFTRTPMVDWKSVKFDNSLNYIFLHQTISGSKLHSGIDLKHGIDPKFFSGIQAKIYSGHIHIPQIVGTVEYVGSPYHVYFGDEYRGRGILIKNNTSKDLYFQTIRRHSLKITSIKELEKIKTNPKDQCKVEIQLQRRELFQWANIKKGVREWCQDRGVALCSLKLVPMDKTVELDTPIEVEHQMETIEDIVNRFSKNEKLSRSFVRVGLDIVRG